MLQNKIQNTNKKVRVDFYDVLRSSLVDEVNIYNKAFLQLTRPLVETSRVHKQTSYELAFKFKVEGEISGDISCLLDTYDKNINDKDLPAFLSLYKESMNILLGKYLTNIEDRADLFSLISAPINSKTPLEFDLDICDHKTYSMGYKLISDMREFDCRIILSLNKNRVLEV